MSVLDFLSLDGAASEAVARSPMERRLREAGATFEQQGRWVVATHVPGEEDCALAVRDVTHAHRVHEGSDGVLVEFQPGEGRLPVSTGVVWSGDDRPPEVTTDVSAGYAALQIEGPGATNVLRRMTEVELEGLPKVGAVAHIRTIVIRDDRDSYRLVFEQEYGHYLWEVAVDAAKSLGGCPKGTP